MRFRSLIQTVWSGFTSFASSVSGRTLLCGSLAGIYLVTICQQLTAHFGTSLTIIAGITIGLALGLECAAITRKKNASATPEQSRRRFGWAHLVVACWTILFPWAISFTILTVKKFGPDPFTWPLAGRLTFSLSVVLLSGISAFALAKLANATGRYLEQKTVTRTTRPAFISALFLLGVACGILLDVFLTAPLLGIQLAGTIAAVVGIALFPRSFLSISSTEIPTTEAPTTASTSIVEHSPPSRNDPLVRNYKDTIWACLVACCFGAVMATVVRIIHQLFPVSSFLVYVEWATLIGGIALGRLWIDYRQKKHLTKTASAKQPAVAQNMFLPVGTLLFTALWSVCFLAAFSLFVDLTLFLNASASHVWMQISGRSLMIATILLPLGIGWGIVIAFSGMRSETGQPGRSFACLPQMQTAMFAVGFLLVRWVLFGLWGPAVVMVSLAWLLLLLGAAYWLRKRTIPRTRAGKLITTGALCFVLSAGIFQENYQPARSARLLFSTNVFVARNQGIKPEYLMHLDENRLVATLEGEQGTYTAWKFRGSQFQIRENGIPKAVISSNRQLSPHFTSEAMQAITPLVLHESPRDVLILGMGSGVPLTTALWFPVQNLTCVESDPQLVKLLETISWNPQNDNPLKDDRVRLINWDPTLAIVSDGNHYDVIISNPSQPMLMQSTPYFTREFYQHASGRLAADGIFCQRFQLVDFGARPLQTAVATLRSVFKHVIAIEPGSGELLFLATNSPRKIVREGLVERMQSPHVRRTLSEIGWDWTVPLNLVTLRDQSLAEIAKAGSSGINSATNNLFAFSLPREVLRWGNKWEERQNLTSRHAKRFLEWDSVDQEDPDLVRRLEDVHRQREYMIAFPDQFWAYRKPLKERIIREPRSKIVQVKGTLPRREMHPEDKRRLNYFVQLGKTAAQQHPTLDDIEQVVEFADPYDPMISYFLHQEVAELYSRAADKDPEQELIHRLHAIYYAHPQDRSVKNVSSALNFLADHPDVAEPQQLWDHFNALCQVLKTRWEIRGAVIPKSSRIVLNDIEQSLTALRNAMDDMDALSRELPGAEEDWKLRRKHLEISFIRPLRAYRNKLRKRYLEQQEATQKLIKKAISTDLDNTSDE